MDKRQTFRWSILLCSLGLTIGAIFYPVDEPRLAESVSPLRPVPIAPSMPKPAFGQAAPITAAAREWLATDEDPFAPRGWIAPPPPPPPAPPQPPAPVDAPPPPPPPLPYKVVGQMSDGTDQVVYLKSGDQVLLARNGEMLEGSYRVVAVTANQIEFESVASGIRQSLPLNLPDN